MMRSLLLLVTLLASERVEAQRQRNSPSPTRASVGVTPEARSLFERDWVLMNWALKYFDSDHDLLLDPGEAAAAAARFREIADTNRDGRVSTAEYRAARALLLSQ